MNFSSNFFLKVDLIGFFPELHVRKFRKFSPDHFYDLKNRFYDKKTDFRPETRESMTSETTRALIRCCGAYVHNFLGGQPWGWHWYRIGFPGMPAQREERQQRRAGSAFSTA